MSDKQAKPSLSNEHNYGLQYDQNKSDLADNNDTRKLKEETIDANKPELTEVLEPLQPSPSVGNNDDNKKNGKDAHSRPLQKNAKQGGLVQSLA